MEGSWEGIAGCAVPVDVLNVAESGIDCLISTPKKGHNNLLLSTQHHCKGYKAIDNIMINYNSIECYSFVQMQVATHAIQFFDEHTEDAIYVYLQV